jgi:hypothetical protein
MAMVTVVMVMVIMLFVFGDCLFDNVGNTKGAYDEVGDKDDHHLPDLLNLYQARVYTTQVQIVGWHDAGDPAALARVPQAL